MYMTIVTSMIRSEVYLGSNVHCTGGELRLMQQLCRSEMDGLTNGWMHEYTQLRSDSFPGSDHRERIGALCADDAADR